MSEARNVTADDFAEWYAEAFVEIRRAVTLAVGDADLGEEATAEAFAKALVHWPKVRRADSRRAWVYRVALNEARSRFRRLRLERRYLQRRRAEGELHHPPPEEPDTALWRAVSGLPPRTRTAVVLRYVADLSVAEVAEAMGVATGSVSATLHHARKRLAQVLSEEPKGAER
ncbi:sigma-70 family RNA polymerase sigma factor [Streptosporangium sp. NPDC048047]|uniref:RNA polymerase sigma factor n=1 Tax=Streptosporangium sp. NPDC048047 TaxID=3155748 RepID=UPI003429C561